MQLKSKTSLLMIFLFVLVISISSVCAEELDDTNNDLSIGDEDVVSVENPNDGFVDEKLAVDENDNNLNTPPKANSTFDGVVSGDVDVITVGPWANKSADLNYEIPSDAKDIKNAIVYVNIYSGSASNPDWGLDSNTSITTINGNVNLGYETLWTSQCSLDDKVYVVNDHITRVASDYQIIYNVTDIVRGLNGTSISIHVDSINNTNYIFDGRIKLLGLLLAYDDGDDDVIKYWVDANQRYTKENVSLEFNTDSLNNVFNAVWTNVVLSSTDASYKINGKPLGDPDNYTYLNNYKYNKWNVTENVMPSTNTTMTFSNNGYSIKSVLSVLTVNEIEASATVKVADYTQNIIYPNFNNRLAVTVTTNKAGKYTINLLENNTIVNSTEVELISGENPVIYIIDPKSRDFKESSHYIGSSGSYDMVNYKVELLFNDVLINESSCEATVLYNGYLGKDTYNQSSFEYDYTTTINGDIVIMTNGTYAGGTDVYQPVSYEVVFAENSTVVKAFVYVTYCWAKNAEDNINMFNATLNGNNLTPIFFTRDQSNLKSLYGYGVVIYDATGYVINGTNVLNVVRNIESVAIYPSTLIYLYNTTGSEVVKEVYIANGADLLGTSGGIRHPVRVDSTIAVDANDVKDATAYIFANGATDGKAVVVINGVAEEHPWNGDSYSTDLCTKDITDTIKENNNISVILNPKEKITITALQQIIVITKKTTVPADEAFNVNNPADTKTPTYSINLPKDATGKFAVSVDGKVYETKELVDGSASITVKNLVAGTHDIVVSYSGDGNYSAISKKTTITIKEDVKPVTPTNKKAATKIVAKKKTFKAKVKVKKYTITLKSGKKAVKKVWVTLKVKGKTYKAKTNAKGKAVFKIKNLKKKGKYTATIKFKGNKNYRASTNKVKITVKK